MPSSRSGGVVVRLYRAIVALGPRETRARHGDEQVQLFEALWLEERPAGAVAATRWICAMFWGALAAAIGGRRDRRRQWIPLASMGAPGPKRDSRITMSDLRYAVRSLAHAKWFTIGAILTFALAIGVNIAIFSIVDRVLFRPLPFQNPRDLVLVTSFSPSTGTRYTSLSKTIAIEARRRADVIKDLGFAGLADPYRFVGSSESPLSLVGASWNILDVLGVHPAAGRGFLPEDVAAKHVVAMLTYEVWQRRFGGQTNVFGKLLTGGGRSATAEANGPFELVGVLPPDFVLPSVNWAAGGDGIVLSLESLDAATRTGVVFPGVFARLKPGATVEALQNEIDALFASVNPETPPEKRGHAIVERLQEGVFWRYNLSLTLLFSGASLVWLLGCANLGTLILARARAREADVAVRMALGATRGRILSAAFLESLIVCAAGSTVAAAVLALTMKSLTAIMPARLQTVVVTSMDARIVVFTVLGAAIGAVAAGLYPAWRSTQVDPNLTLKQGTSTGRRVTGRSGRGLLVIQSAVGTVLVVAAALTIRSLVGLLTMDLGYDPSGLYGVGFQLARPAVASAPVVAAPAISPDERLSRIRRSIEQLRQAPGVVGVSGVSHAVFDREMSDQIVDDAGRSTLVRRVLEDYFEVMRTPMVAGRTFTADEIKTSAPVVVLTRGAVGRFWPETSAQQAIGRTVRFASEPARLVVGVVPDSMSRPLAPVEPEVFTPIRTGDRLVTILRARPGQPLEGAALIPAFSSVYGSVTSVVLTSVSEWIEPTVRDPKLFAKIFGAFAFVALLLSSVGLFAIASGEVSRRFYEIGVRRTLGANTAQIRRLILGDALRPVALGVVMGGICAWWVASVMQSLLVNVNPRDPWTYAIVAFVLLATAALAAWAPARRASRIDPAVILRAQ